MSASAWPELLPILIFWSCTLLAAYFLIGYPLLLRFRPLNPLPVAKDLAYTPRVSILVAVHNGQQFLSAKLDSILALEYPAELMEIWILSDGSTDATESIAANYASRGVHCLPLPRGGKASSLNVGLAHATGEILFFTDVRQPLHPHALRHLVANFADPGVGAVTGELRIGAISSSGQPVHDEQASMDLYWRYELWVRSLHSQRFSLFNTTGCLYAMRRSLASPLRPDTLIDDAELPLQAYRQGFRIVFDPNAIAYDYATAPGAEWRRRMRTLGGMWQVFAWHPELLFKPHPMWLDFVSHKFGRLLLPWLLLATVLASVALPPSLWRTLLLGSEFLLPLLALARPLLTPWPSLARFSGLAQTFLTMNWAALSSLRVFFTDPSRLWLANTPIDQRAASKSSAAAP